MYDQDGKTALHRAVEMGHAVVVRALLAKGASVTPFPVSHSVRVAWCGSGCWRDFDPFQDWRFLGFVNPQDEWTPLHVAAKNGLVLIAQLLLEWGSIDYTLRVRHIAIKLSRDRRFDWFVCVRLGLTVWKKIGSDAVSQSVSQSVSQTDGSPFGWLLLCVCGSDSSLVVLPISFCCCIDCLFPSLSPFLSISLTTSLPIYLFLFFCCLNQFAVNCWNSFVTDHINITLNLITCD
jgi:hypothetical protein